MKRVAVTGMGVVSPLGCDVETAFGRLKVLRNCVERSDDLATYKGLHTCLWAPCGSAW